MFETVLFLKVNKRLWDATLILQAMEEVKKDISNECVVDRMVEEDELDVIEEDVYE